MLFCQIDLIPYNIKDLMNLYHITTGKEYVEFRDAGIDFGEYPEIQGLLEVLVRTV
jgi:hypothetical protein